MNSYNDYLNSVYSQKSIEDVFTVTAPQIAGAIAAIFGLNSGLEWSANRRKEQKNKVELHDKVMSSTEKCLLFLKGSDSNIGYDLYLTDKQLIMTSGNKNFAVFYRDLEYIRLHQSLFGSNLTFKSTITGWRQLAPNKAQLKQLSLVLPTIAALNGKLEIK